MKKIYKDLEMEVIEFDAEDVITASEYRPTRQDGYVDDGEGSIG